MLSVCLATLVLSAPIYSQSEEEINAYLKENGASQIVFKENLRKTVLDTIGTPYVDGPLGVGQSGKYDTDPLINLRKVDCVTYVEQTVAMATAQSYEDLVRNLQKIRYKGGQIDFETRNHFMISDWIRNNGWCTDVTAKLPVETERITRKISKKEFFVKVNAPGLGSDVQDEDVTLQVVPPEFTASAEAGIPDGSLIVFVGKVDWLFALHCGVYLRDEDGKGSLVHASSKAGQVVAMPLTKYMSEQASRYVGFSVYEMSQPDLEE